MNLLNIKPYTTLVYRTGGHEIRMKVRRPKWDQVISFGELAMRMWEEIAATAVAGQEITNAQTLALVRAQAELLQRATPEALRALFAGLIYDVEGVALDDQPITTGEALFDVADGDLVMAVLLHVYGASRVSGLEGKGSASPSISPQDDAAPLASPVPSTGNESGTGTSTATGDPAIESSGAPGQ